MRYIIMISLSFLMVLSIPIAFAQDVNLYIFHGRGCPHCARALVFLDELTEKYPELNVIDYEVYFNDTNRELFMRFCSEVDKSVSGVPTMFIDKKTFIGFSNKVASQIEDAVKECIEKGCEDIHEKCINTQQVIGNTDPIIPFSNGKYAFIGWGFIFGIIFAVVFVIVKRKMKK